MLVQLRNNSRIACLAVSCLIIVMSGCSGGGGGSKNPVPAVTSLSPASATAGAAPQTLTINGTGFISSAGAGFVSLSTVTFNGVAHSAIYVSATQLTITLTAADQATGGNYVVLVANPYPGGGSSSAVNFTVNNPVPKVTAISPSTALAGAAAQTITVTGTGFVPGSTVTFNGVAVTPTITSSTQLTFPLTAANQAVVGSFQVVVSNPAPGGGSSSPVSFLVKGGTILNGAVYKGASVGSTVTAYEVNADGSDGTAIGTATTASDGTFSLTLTGSPTGAVRLTATGGNYVSEFDASTITGTSGVSALLDTATKTLSGISITPASELVSSYTAGLLSTKTVTDEPTAHKKAEALIGGYIGLSATAVIETLVPVFDKPSIAANPDGFTLGLWIGALATEGNQVSTSPDNLIAALSADISDGIFDGKAFGTAVPLPDPTTSSIRMRQTSATVTPAIAASPGTLSPTAGTTDTLLALGTYITTGSTPAKAGTSLTDVSSLEGAIFGGVSNCSCTPPSIGLLASSAGATTTYSLRGHQYLIVAARQEGVVVVDITDPTTKTPPINAWPSISSTTFGGADVGGVIAVTGLSGYPEVVTFAYQSTTISILNLATLITGDPKNVATDPADNPVVLTTTLALTATSPVGFSGGQAFIAGGIPDNGRLGVWLDTADGIGLLKLSSLTAGAASVPLLPLYPSEESNLIIPENMGGDIVNNQLLGAAYGGIGLTDLTKGAIYYMPSETILSTFPGVPPSPFDGNSIDSNLKVGILTYEDTPYASFLNLATVTETDSTNGGPNTLTPAAGGLVSVTLGSEGPVLSGSAVDKQSHLALFMAGYSQYLAVGMLQDPSKVPAGTAWTGLTDWSYFLINDSPELADYAYATDPHSVGVVVNQTTGTPYGYLFDGSTDRGIVQVDLTNFLALPRAGTTGDPAHQPGVDPGAAVAPNGGLVLQEFTWMDPTAPLAAIKHKTQEELPNQPMIPAPKKK